MSHDDPSEYDYEALDAELARPTPQPDHAVEWARCALDAAERGKPVDVRDNLINFRRLVSLAEVAAAGDVADAGDVAVNALALLDEIERELNANPYPGTVLTGLDLVSGLRRWLEQRSSAGLTAFRREVLRMRERHNDSFHPSACLVCTRLLTWCDQVTLSSQLDT